MNSVFTETAALQEGIEQDHFLMWESTAESSSNFQWSWKHMAECKGKESPKLGQWNLIRSKKIKHRSLEDLGFF